ncbi:hypothetical protein D0864_15885 [Hortaea werneckii]|uniref:Uncharacterized protein n=1 Tax=Hortaea werneckii TaxID=91943 RepID=A0A3M7BTW0_HORWE|nr:hypothetical protein KC352_g17864 [Hortaea werneckii]KAI7554536.1 hypothetical protein KC317_g13240 [Hortaea werneckii]KAI7602107.1 hypothetical protein KC346_g12515 [Hortaea werneckii]KAI7640792.1 hypothetical protein KC319_g13809 [Hortaea werneckii]KAI7687191.1 hypothetical protein KC322_g12565 [Hortaea werneckii]
MFYSAPFIQDVSPAKSRPYGSKSDTDTNEESDTEMEKFAACLADGERTNKYLAGRAAAEGKQGKRRWSLRRLSVAEPERDEEQIETPSQDQRAKGLSTGTEAGFDGATDHLKPTGHQQVAINGRVGSFRILSQTTEAVRERFLHRNEASSSRASTALIRIAPPTGAAQHENRNDQGNKRPSGLQQSKSMFYFGLRRSTQAQPKQPEHRRIGYRIFSMKSAVDNQLVIRSARPENKVQHSYSPKSCFQLIPRKVRLPAIAKDDMASTHIKRGSYHVKGTRFELLKPPLPTSRLEIPPRGASKNFSMPRRQKSGLERLPQELRKRIFGLVLLESRELLVCGCGNCDVDAVSVQPPLTMTNRQFRSEALSIYYKENRFLLKGTYDYRDQAPAWLATLSQSSRNMLRHVEINTHDVIGAIAMMATLGLQLAYCLPRREHLLVMSNVERQTIWLTFTASEPNRREIGKAAEPTPTTPLRVWDDEERFVPQRGYTSTGNHDNISTSSTVGTSILDPKFEQDAGYDAAEYQQAVVFGRGMMARKARGKMVTISSPSKSAKKVTGLKPAVCAKLPKAPKSRKALLPAPSPVRRYSVGREILRASSDLTTPGS